MAFTTGNDNSGKVKSVIINEKNTGRPVRIFETYDGEKCTPIRVEAVKETTQDGIVWGSKITFRRAFDASRCTVWDSREKTVHVAESVDELKAIFKRSDIGHQIDYVAPKEGFKGVLEAAANRLVEELMPFNYS